MARAARAALIVAAAVLALSGCARQQQAEPKLMFLRSDGQGPDEFAILPTKPIEIPKNLAELPPPDPGGRNRVDPDPEADAVAALGGRLRPADARVPDSDRALLAATGRYGVARDIRQTLAAEDLEFRRKNRGRILERIFGVTVYFKAYKPMWLDQYAELERLRRAGIRTPAAPPPVYQRPEE